MASGPVIVDSDGFIRVAGRHLGIAGVVHALRSELVSAEDMAHRVRCSEAAESIAKARPLLRTAAVDLELSHVIFSERAKWAKLAERDPAIRKYLTAIMSYGPDSVNFLTVSAFGGANGLRKLANRWPTMTKQMAFRQVPFVDTLVFSKLADARASADFVWWEMSVNGDVVFKAKRYGTKVMPHLRTQWDLKLNAEMAKRFDAYAAQAGKWVGNADAFGKWLDGRFGIKGAGIDVLLKFWELSQSDFYTDAQKAKILVATAGSSIALFGLAALAGLGCTAIGTPAAGVACSAAVGVGGGFAAGAVIDKHWPEDYEMPLDEYLKKVAPEVWKARQTAFISSELRKLPPRHLETLAYNEAYKRYGSRDPMGDPEGYAKFERFRLQELERLDEAHREAARQAFYRQTHWPPKDPVDRLRVQQQNEAMWQAKLDEIRSNKDD